jgi:two-component system KDP operon response regulator KdpE
MTAVAKILVVDDEVALLRALSTGLRARGYELSTAQTGVEGLSKIALEDPDVVVLDLGLPDIDGVEVCRRLRQWTEVPVVVLSAHGGESPQGGGARRRGG